MHHCRKCKGRCAYHALHSADKWFINPNVYEEPPFHEAGMDNPENPTIPAYPRVVESALKSHRHDLGKS